MAKLWQKNYDLNSLIEKFTVGDDYLLDRHLAAADCVASAAHAAMLASIGILSAEEAGRLREELSRLIDLAEKGEFVIKRGDEDCHTAIENHLTEKVGEAGKKIHTARSRNDQVIAALRLFCRDFILDFEDAVFALTRELIVFAEKHAWVPMPGRTHMQIAMPSSLGLWAGAFAEALIDDCRLVATAYELNDMCPLGSAASYGVPLAINREMTSDLLGFAKLQNNVLYVNNSRGKIEAIVLEAAEQVVLTLSKLAQDLIVYSMPEFAYFSLPAELCSGSSIMPQKKNPCGLELLRAKCATISSSVAAVKNIIKGLPSGYNRDFQETKGHLMRGLFSALECVRVMTLTIEKLIVHEPNLRKGFIPEIYATDRALELVREGMSFREAYRRVGLALDELKARDPVQAIREKTHSGAPGNLNLDKAQADLEGLASAALEKRRRVDAALLALLGKRPRLADPF